MANNKIMIFIYDKDSKQGDFWARQGYEVHSWHTANPNTDEPEVTVFPGSDGVLLTHGNSFDDFETMMCSFMKMEGSEIGMLKSFNWRGVKLLEGADKFRNFMTQEAAAQ